MLYTTNAIESLNWLRKLLKTRGALIANGVFGSAEAALPNDEAILKFCTSHCNGSKRNGPPIQD